MSIFIKSAAAITAISLAATPIMPAMAANVGHSMAVHSGTNVLEQSVTSDYRQRYRHRHYDSIDGGDILAGIGILAGIAIIASAASNNNKRRSDDRYPQTYPNQYPQQSDYRNSSNDVSSAVSACSEAAEREAGSWIDEIDSVNRDGNGWRVEGELSGGDARSFSCVASEGIVESIRFDDRDL